MNDFIDFLSGNIYLQISIGLFVVVILLSFNKRFIAFDEKIERSKKTDNDNYSYGKALTEFSCPVCSSEISSANRLKKCGAFLKQELRCPECESIVYFDSKSSMLLSIGYLCLIVNITLHVFGKYLPENLHEIVVSATGILGFVSLVFLFWGLSSRKLVAQKNSQ